MRNENIIYVTLSHLYTLIVSDVKVIMKYEYMGRPGSDLF